MIMGTMKSVIQRLRFPLEIMLVCVRLVCSFTAVRLKIQQNQLILLVC
jgi:hypothetical protein